MKLHVLSGKFKIPFEFSLSAQRLMPFKQLFFTDFDASGVFIKSSSKRG